MTSASQTIGIIDYGMGNLHSMQKALQHVAPNASVVVSGDLSALSQADRLVFPGVGAIRDCMVAINNAGLNEFLPKVLVDNRPVLAVCVGMQALFERSEENNGVAGMGLLKGEVKRFTHLQNPAMSEKLKIPHMGWNATDLNEHELWQGIEQRAYFYYVHSYFCQPAEPSIQTAEAFYPQAFTAGVARGSLFATQFHPEKSADNGLQLLKNFTQWRPS